jgi:hypothetical protein
MNPQDIPTHSDNGLLFDLFHPSIGAPLVVGFPAFFPPGAESTSHGANFGMLNAFLDQGRYQFIILLL